MINKQKDFYSSLFTLLCLLGILSACTVSATSSDRTPTTEFPDLIQEVSASAEVIPIRWVTLAYLSGSDELILEVNEGDQVIEGDVLVQSNDQRFVSAIYQAEAALARAQNSYNHLLNFPTEAALSSARSAVKNAKANLERQQELEANETVIEAAQSDLEAAQAALEELLSEPTQLEITAAENDTKAAVWALRQAKQASALRAPFSGTVVEIFVNPGESIGALQPVLTMADLTEFQAITTNLGEVDVARLEVGQTANIFFDALSEKTFQGKIEKIAQRSSGTSSVYYEVTLSLDEQPEEIRWGMTAFVVFPLQSEN
jgi:multidrug efflux pump subunit AcrA (membrane-fusion protein)